MAYSIASPLPVEAESALKAVEALSLQTAGSLSCGHACYMTDRTATQTNESDTFYQLQCAAAEVNASAQPPAQPKALLVTLDTLDNWCRAIMGDVAARTDRAA